MICASCNAPMDQPVETCVVCGYPTLLLDRFQLVSTLSRGGDTGTLYLAMDTEGDAPVVVREIELRGLPEPSQLDACDAAYASLHGVSLPGVAFWRDRRIVGRCRNRTLYAVQDYVQGRPLSERAGRPLPPDRALAILDEVLAILEGMHAHAPPLSHRDLKPDNVLRQPDGALILVDAGGARDVLIGSRAAMGQSPHAAEWLAPEQRAGGGGPASDIYAAGLLTLFLLTGEPPDTLRDAAGRLQWRERAALDPKLTQALARMLREQPARRPASVSGLRALLRELQQVPLVGDPPTLDLPDTRPLPEPAAPPADRRRALIGGAATLGVVAAAGAMGGGLGAGITASIAAVAITVALRTRATRPRS